jgi:lysophospholipase L1-like esterase
MTMRRATGQHVGRRRPYLRRTAALLIAAALATTTAWGTVDAMRATQTPAPGSTLVVLGDSLTWGTNFFAKSQKRLEASQQFEKVIVDSRWGRRISGLNSVRYSGNVALKQLVTSGVRPTAVIVALGTNDVAILNKQREFAAVIQELMTTIGNVPVVWVTVHRVDSASTTRKSQRFNNTLAQVLSNYPLASVYDWVSVVKSKPRVMDPDKIHLTPLGHEVRTQVYLELATVLAQRAAETTPTTVAPTTTVGS